MAKARAFNPKPALMGGMRALMMAGASPAEVIHEYSRQSTGVEYDDIEEMAWEVFGRVETVLRVLQTPMGRFVRLDKLLDCGDNLEQVRVSLKVRVANPRMASGYKDWYGQATIPRYGQLKKLLEAAISQIIGAYDEEYDPEEKGQAQAGRVLETDFHEFECI